MIIPEEVVIKPTEEERGLDIREYPGFLGGGGTPKLIHKVSTVLAFVYDVLIMRQVLG